MIRKSILFLILLLLMVFSSCNKVTERPDLSLEPQPAPTSTESLPPSPDPTETPSERPDEIETKVAFTYVKYEPIEGFEPCFTMEYACSENILRYAYKLDEETVKYGYMDMEFNVLSYPISDYASIFINGLAKISGGGSVSIINKNMEPIEVKNHNLPFQYNGEWYQPYRLKQNIYVLDSAKFYYTGFNLLQESQIQDDKYLIACSTSNDLVTGQSLTEAIWGYKTIEEMSIDEDNESSWTIPPLFEDAKEFHENLAAVEVDGKWGFIDNNGNIVIDCEYQFVRDFNGGIAIVAKEILDENSGMMNLKFGTIDYNGEIVVDLIYDVLSEYKESFAHVPESKNNWIFIDINGDKLGQSSHLYLDNFNEGMALVQDSEGYSFIDSAGNYINTEYYLRARSFSEGLAAVQPGPWGYINTRGEYVIEPEFNEAGDFNEGYALVANRTMKEYIHFIIDINGNQYLNELNLSAISKFNKDGYALAYSEVTEDEETERTYYMIHRND